MYFIMFWVVLFVIYIWDENSKNEKGKQKMMEEDVNRCIRYAKTEKDLINCISDIPNSFQCYKICKCNRNGFRIKDRPYNDIEMCEYLRKRFPGKFEKALKLRNNYMEFIPGARELHGMDSEGGMFIENHCGVTRIVSHF